MSAIGDYIHLTAAGYENHGTYSFNTTKTNFKSATQVLNRVHDQVSTAAKNKPRQNLTGLAEAISSLMVPPDNSSSEQKKALDDLWNALMKNFREEFNYAPLDIIRKTGNVLMGKFIDIKELKGIDKKASFTYLNNILQKVATIERQKELIKNEMDKNELENILKMINKELIGIIDEGQKALVSTEYDLTDAQERILKAAKMNAISQTASSGRQLKGKEREKIVELINNISAQTAMCANLQKGTLFEEMIALAPIAAAYQGVTNLKEYINTTVVGSSGRTSVQFNPSKFITGVDFAKVLGKKYRRDINNNLYIATGSTQDKVDVQIEWKGQPVKISAKNVNLKGGGQIHILSGASLLVLLSQMDTDFVNHYLNIVANHKDGSIESELVTLAHNSFKPTLLYQALAGYKTNAKTGYAEVFIVNDNSNIDNVKVFSIADLIMDAVDNMNEYVSITSDKQDLSNIHFANTEKSHYSERITQLLADVHTYKIDVAINSSLLAATGARLAKNN